MALKEKALKRLTEKLNAAGVVWGVYGDFVRAQRGEDVAWHGFELMTGPDQLAAADKVLTRLGMRHEEAGGIAYHFDGADVLLTVSDTFTAADLDGTITVLGVAVPVLRGTGEEKA